MQIIGYVNGRAVRYAEETQTIGVYGTSVKLYGVKSVNEALEQCARNLNNFKAVK